MSKIDVTLLVILLVGFYTVISAVVYFFYETYNLCKKDKNKTMSLAALGGIALVITFAIVSTAIVLKL